MIRRQIWKEGTESFQNIYENKGSLYIARYNVVLGAKLGKRIAWFSTAKRKFSLPIFRRRRVGEGGRDTDHGKKKLSAS